MKDLRKSKVTALVDTKRILYTPSSFAKATLFYLQEVGYLKALHEHSSARTDMDSCLFIMVNSGSGKLFYGNREYELHTGDCVFIDCKEDYMHQTDIRDLWSLSWCHFYGPNMRTIYNKYKERGGLPVFHPNNTASYKMILQSLFDMAQTEDYVRDMRLHEKLSGLLVLLMEDAWNSKESSGTAVLSEPKSGVRDIHEIKEYLDENFKSKITLDELSQEFYIDKFYLTELFKRRYGITIVNYLLRLRVTYVKEQLRFTDRALEDIADELCLGVSYLSRTFKKIEGINPSEYRKKWK